MEKFAETYPQMYLYRRIVQAKLFIDEHYANALDLNDIADEACFSKFHFIRLFKKIYRKTPHQYLIAVRMQHALQLLQKDMNVSDVCFAVGFESPGSFTTLFRKYFHISPSEYLLKHQQQQLKIREQPLGFVPGCYVSMNNWDL
jgi:AraC-like DNA-binding protein